MSVDEIYVNSWNICRNWITEAESTLSPVILIKKFVPLKNLMFLAIIQQIIINIYNNKIKF